MIELNFPNPVSQDRDFYGRRAERAVIERTLRSGTGCPVVVFGERRIGKTSLLLVTVKHLAAEEGSCYVPLILPPAAAMCTLQDYGREILQSVCSAVGEDARKTSLFDNEGRFRFPSYGRFTETLAQLLPQSLGKTFILCVDELDAMILGRDQPQEATGIVALTDHLRNARLPLVIFLTMTRIPDLLRKSYQSPVTLFEAEQVVLNPFSESETIEMVNGLLKTEIELAPQAMTRLLELSGGHPYFVKLLLYHLLAHHRFAANPRAITEAMFEAALPDAVADKSVASALDNLYEVHFTRDEQTLMLLLANREQGITSEQLEVPGPPFQKAAKRLVARGYLAQDDHTRSYRFRVGFLGRWFPEWERYEEELEGHTIEQLAAGILRQDRHVISSVRE